MQLIDGKKVAAQIKQEIAAEVKNMIAAGKKQPHLAAILVGLVLSQKGNRPV